MIDIIREVRHFIANRLDYKPMEGMADQQQLAFERIAYTEPQILNNDLWSTLEEIY